MNRESLPFLLATLMSVVFAATAIASLWNKSAGPDEPIYIAAGIGILETGDFRINDRWSVLVEFSGHYADMDYAQIFVMGHIGVGFHF